MTWSKLNHECRKPGGNEVRRRGAQPGSIWECETEGCDHRWELLNDIHYRCNEPEWGRTDR